MAQRIIKSKYCSISKTMCIMDGEVVGKNEWIAAT